MEEKDYSELLSAYNEGTQTVIQKIRDELNEDALFTKLETEYDVYDLLNFNEFNLKERLERLAFHMKDFKLKYLQELANVEKIKDRLDKVVGEKYQALRNGEVSLTKTEIEKYYLTTDEEVLKLKALLRKQEIRAKYFEAVWSAFDKMGWNIRNYIEMNKGGF
jgi:hypothetical protein